MARRGEVLVAILTQRRDFNLVRDQHWYRIPVDSAPKWLSGAWPPNWLALYQTKVFGVEAHAVNYVARVIGIRQVQRWELFPNEPRDARSEKAYHQLLLDGIERLPV